MKHSTPASTPRADTTTSDLEALEEALRVLREMPEQIAAAQASLEVQLDGLGDRLDAFVDDAARAEGATLLDETGRDEISRDEISLDEISPDEISAAGSSGPVRVLVDGDGRLEARVVGAGLPPGGIPALLSHLERALDAAHREHRRSSVARMEALRERAGAATPDDEDDIRPEGLADALAAEVLTALRGYVGEGVDDAGSVRVRVASDGRTRIGALRSGRASASPAQVIHAVEQAYGRATTQIRNAAEAAIEQVDEALDEGDS